MSSIIDFFSFTKDYRKIADRLEEKFGRDSALFFYKALTDYAFDGIEPANDFEWVEKAWPEIKKKVDAQHAESRRAANGDWKRNGRTLEDLSNEEFDAAYEMYQAGEKYIDIRNEFHLKYFSVDPDKLKAERQRRIGVKLRLLIESDREFAELLEELSGYSIEEWIEHSDEITTSVDDLRALFEWSESDYLVHKEFYEQYYEGREGDPGSYWRSISCFAEEHIKEVKRKERMEEDPCRQK